MKYKKVTITPELAEEWLKRNTCNKPMSTSKVIDFGVEMAEGRWGEDSHQGISFAIDGSLTDGQHRLAAIALAGVTLNLWVATGQPLKQGSIFTRDVIDTGGKRTPGDILCLERDIPNSKDAGAITNQISRIIHTGQTRPSRITVPVQAFIYDIYKDEIDAVVGASKSVRGLRNGAVLACFAVAAKDHFDDTIIFEESFWDGANLEYDSPVLALRNYMLAAQGEKTRIQQHILYRACLYCLYCYVKTKQVRRLKINNVGIDYFLRKQANNIAKIKDYIGTRSEIAQAARAALRKKVEDCKPVWCPNKTTRAAIGAAAQ